MSTINIENLDKIYLDPDHSIALFQTIEIINTIAKSFEADVEVSVFKREIKNDDSGIGASFIIRDKEANRNSGVVGRKVQMAIRSIRSFIEKNQEIRVVYHKPVLDQTDSSTYPIEINLGALAKDPPGYSHFDRLIAEAQKYPAQANGMNGRGI